MRYRRHVSRDEAGVAFNATPMIDVIFTLTIFFMLVTRFSEAENVPMEVPRPVHSEAKTAKIPDRVVINCLVGEAGDDPARRVLYRIGPNLPEPLSVIVDRLAAMKEQNPELKVIIRADRRLPYEDVRAVMRAVSSLHVEMVNVAAEASGSD
jgi:biopolymer transport protein TolR